MEIQNLNDQLLPVILLGSGGALVLTALVIIFFMRYQKRTQQQREYLLRRELQHGEQLLHANISAQEAERIRISRDLHDHVGSTLSTLRLLVTKIDRAAPADTGIHQMTGEYKEMIDGVIADVRNISHSLAPPGLALWGLRESLEALCEKTASSTGIPVQIDAAGPDPMAGLVFDHALALYRVFQELIANTLKHAAATAITITISADSDAVTLVYHDNGMGTDLATGAGRGNGMSNIESRLKMIGASAAMTSKQGNGFTCTISLPATSKTTAA